MQSVPNNRFFYDYTTEDALVARLMELNKIDVNARPCEIPDNFNRRVFSLDLTSLQNFLSLAQRTINISGRCRQIPLNVSLNIQGFVLRVHHLGVKLLLDGGAMWRVIVSMMEPILQEWLKDTVNTSLLHEMISTCFQSTLETDLNDVDWQLRSDPPGRVGVVPNLVNELTTMLAESLNSSSVSNEALYSQINHAREIAKAQPQAFYWQQLFVCHPYNPSNRLDLCRLFVDTFAFSTAADIFENENWFFLRSFGDEIPHDIIFPIKTRTTTTWINSLFIDATALIQQEELTSAENLPIVNLRSFLGNSIEDILQAIVSKLTNAIYFDPSQAVDFSEFVLLIAHFTFAGHSYQRGCFVALLKSMQMECQNRKTSFSKLIVQELTRYVRQHRKNDPSVLLAMYFNTAALLYDHDPIHESDIQELWQELQPFISSHHSIDPVIKEMQKAMKECPFGTIYAQLQVSSHIAQHHTKKSLCLPSQTNGQIYTQIRIPRAMHQPGTLNFVTLFFPYDLYRAMCHLETVQTLPKSLMTLHESLVDKTVSFGLDMSMLKGSHSDIRRQFDVCLAQALELLNSQKEEIWSSGYLLVLSQMAQKTDIESMQHLIDAFIDMLMDSWASQQFKLQQLAVLQASLMHSRVAINIEEAKQSIVAPNKNGLSNIYTALIKAFVKSDTPLFLDIALVLLDRADTKFTQSALKTLYLSLAKLTANEDMIIALLERIKSASFPMLYKLKLYLGLYSKRTVASSANQEKMLFDMIVKALKSFNNCDALTPEHAEIISKITRAMLSSPNRSENPFRRLELMNELSRLKLIDNSESAGRFWLATTGQVLSTAEENNIYLMQCFTLANETGWWHQLDRELQETFCRHYKIMLEQSLQNLPPVAPLSSFVEHPQLLLAAKETIREALKPKIGPDATECPLTLSLIDQWLLTATNFADHKLLFDILKNMSEKILSESHFHKYRSRIEKFSKISSLPFAQGLFDSKSWQALTDFYLFCDDYFEISAPHYLLFVKALLHDFENDTTFMANDSMIHLLHRFEQGTSQQSSDLTTNRQQLYALLSSQCQKKQKYTDAQAWQEMGLACSSKLTNEFFTRASSLSSEIADHGTLEETEKALSQMLVPMYENFIYSKEHQSCLKMLLERLVQENSLIFLDHTLWSSLLSTSSALRAQRTAFVPLMLEGAVTALFKEPSLPDLNKFASQLFHIVLKNTDWQVNEFDMLVYENRILVLGKEVKVLNKGLGNLIKIFASEQSSAKQRLTAVHMTNEFVFRMLPYKENKSINLTVSCIKHVYQSTLHKKADHFTMLNYLVKMHAPAKLNTVLNEVLSALKALITDGTTDSQDPQASDLIRSTLKHLDQMHADKKAITQPNRQAEAQALHQFFFKWCSTEPRAAAHFQSNELFALRKTYAKELVTGLIHKERLVQAILANIALWIASKSYTSITRNPLPPVIGPIAYGLASALIVLVIIEGVTYAKKYIRK